MCAEVPSSEHSYSRRPRPDVMEMARRCGMQGNVLDVGCAGGVLGEALLREGRVSSVVGIEFDRERAREARGRLTDVVVGDATAEGVIPPGPFDGVILADVIEHVAVPEALLGRIVPRLAEGASVIVSVPNVRHIRNIWNLAVRGDWDYVDEGICDRTHLRFFTFGSVTELLGNVGLEPRVVLGSMSGRGVQVSRYLPGSAHFLSTQLILGCAVIGARAKPE